MTLNFEDKEHLRRAFLKELNWFEEELDLLFNGKTSNFTQEDFKLAEKILDGMSEIINKYSYEEFLYVLTSKLNNINKKYPELFKNL
ncbi:MAG: hypothetical protein ACQERB_00110 [Promethearchaeati archaeon]